MCERERENACKSLCLCTFNDVSLGTSNIIQVLHFFSKFYSVFLILNLHVRGKEICKEKFTGL